MKQIYVVEFNKYPGIVKLGDSHDPDQRLLNLSTKYGSIKYYDILESPKFEYDFFYHIQLEYYNNIQPLYKSKPNNNINSKDGNTEFYELKFDELQQYAYSLQEGFSNTNFDKKNWLKYYIDSQFKDLDNEILYEDKKKLNNQNGQRILGKVGYMLRHTFNPLTKYNIEPKVKNYMEKKYLAWQEKALSKGWLIGRNNEWTRRISTQGNFFDEIYKSPTMVKGSKQNGHIPTPFVPHKTSIINSVEQWLSTHNQLDYWK